MGRAGAFVAGADDLGALWYNPAGLADANRSILVDFGWLNASTQFDRRLRIVDADNTIRYVDSPRVEGSTPFLPIPTIAASFPLDSERKLTVAGGIFAPYVALPSFPETVNGKPSPARYTLGSFLGSALAMGGGFAAYRPWSWFRVGMGVSALAGIFQSDITFTTSLQDRLIGAPEQPEYDAQSRIRVAYIFPPAVHGGFIVEPHPLVRIGVSAQSPMVVDAPATLQVRLPSSALFDTARVVGQTARVRFRLPSIVRLGVEVRPLETLRVEATYVREMWSLHDVIDVRPQNIALEGIVGAPPSLRLPPIPIPRRFQDSDSFRLGGEWKTAIQKVPLTLRLGVAYETSAVPSAYVSLSSLDFNKVTVGTGLSVHLKESWRLDALYARIFTEDVHTSPDLAQIPRINPISGNAPLEAVNGGSYIASAHLFGVGVVFSY